MLGLTGIKSLDRSRVLWTIQTNAFRKRVWFASLSCEGHNALGSNGDLKPTGHFKYTGCLSIMSLRNKSFKSFTLPVAVTLIEGVN
jgi:hypothetical protein